MSAGQSERRKTALKLADYAYDLGPEAHEEFAQAIEKALAAESVRALEQAAKVCEERGESYTLDPENIDSLAAAVCDGCASVVRSLIPSSAPEKNDG